MDYIYILIFSEGGLWYLLVVNSLYNVDGWFVDDKQLIVQPHRSMAPFPCVETSTISTCTCSIHWFEWINQQIIDSSDCFISSLWHLGERTTQHQHCFFKYCSSHLSVLYWLPLSYITKELTSQQWILITILKMIL